jgi:hypothetical protein
MHQGFTIRCSALARTDIKLEVTCENCMVLTRLETWNPREPDANVHLILECGAGRC